MQPPKINRAAKPASPRLRSCCLLILACQMLAAASFAADAPDHFSESRAQALLMAGQAALEDGDLALAQKTLGQAIQLLKINEGLYSPEQLAPIEQLMWAQMRSGFWPQLDTSLGYYYWLLQRIEATTLDAQLDIARNIRSLYLEAAAHPSNPMPPRYLSAALRTNWQTLSYIEAILGAEHPALLPWLYDSLILQFIESRLNERKGLTNYLYKTDGGEFISGWSLSRRETKTTNHSIGVSMLDKIETIRHAMLRAEGSSDSATRLAELDASLALYRGDWESLVGDKSMAETYYAKPDGLAPFKEIPRTRNLLPRPTFETNPAVLKARTAAADISVSNHWSERFPDVSQLLIDTLAKNRVRSSMP